MAESSAKSNRSLGRAGESIACDFLVKNGFQIVKRNYTVRGGEIDIIAENEKYIIFVEVKTRTAGHSVEKYGRGAAAVNSTKKEHFLFAVKSYMRAFVSEKKPRIDVIEITLENFEGCVATKISHYPNAFGSSR
ncbi:MAG: YraN family protein [Clostridia bacterium]|jgi:putative endonuclease|nr:YraN family protein [Clostridia bacterium]